MIMSKEMIETPEPEMIIPRKKYPFHGTLKINLDVMLRSEEDVERLTNHLRKAIEQCLYQ